MKFNKTAKQPFREYNTNTYEGGSAYTYSNPIHELLAAVSTTFLENKAYETGDQRMDRVKSLIYKILFDADGNYHASDKERDFLWQLAYVIRDEFNLRSISHVLIGELFKYSETRAIVPDYFVSEMWIRPDDMMETVSYYMATTGLGKKKFPNRLRKAIQHRFNRLSTYQASKYSGAKKQLSLADLLRIAHPKPKNEKQSVLFKQIITDTIPKDENWLSKTGTQKASVEGWMEMLPNMPYMAVLKNLNAMLRVGVNPSVLVERIENKKAIEKSRVLPFRFLDALDMVDNKDVKKSLQKAVEYALRNVELPKGRYLIALDDSGSMTFSGGKAVRNAALFGSVLMKYIDNTEGYDGEMIAFSTSLRSIDTFDMGIVGLRNYILRQTEGGGTNGHLVFEYANKVKPFDYIIVLTDMQYSEINGKNYWYREDSVKLHPNTKVLNFNLEGYENTQTPFTPGSNVFEVSGFSSKVFDYINFSTNIDKTIDKIINYRTRKFERINANKK